MALKDWGAPSAQEAFLTQQVMHVAQALGQADRSLEDMRKGVLATQYQTTDLGSKVSKLSDHLGAGMEEIVRLRVEVAQSQQAHGAQGFRAGCHCRLSARRRQTLLHLCPTRRTHPQPSDADCSLRTAIEHTQVLAAVSTLRDIQRSQVAAESVAQQDRHAIAALQHAIATERAGFQAQIVQRDVAIQQLSAEARHQQQMLGEAMLKVDSQLHTQRHEAEQGKTRLESALDTLTQRLAGDERNVESLRQVDAQQKSQLSAELQNLQSGMASEVVRLQSALQNAQLAMVEMNHTLERERQARSADASTFQLRLSSLQAQAENMIRRAACLHC